MEGSGLEQYSTKDQSNLKIGSVVESHLFSRTVSQNMVRELH